MALGAGGVQGTFGPIAGGGQKEAEQQSPLSLAEDSAVSTTVLPSITDCVPTRS